MDKVVLILAIVFNLLLGESTEELKSNYFKNKVSIETYRYSESEDDFNYSSISISSWKQLTNNSFFMLSTGKAKYDFNFIDDEEDKIFVEGETDYRFDLAYFKQINKLESTLFYFAYFVGFSKSEAKKYNGIEFLKVRSSFEYITIDFIIEEVLSKNLSLLLWLDKAYSNSEREDDGGEGNRSAGISLGVVYKLSNRWSLNLFVIKEFFSLKYEEDEELGISLEVDYSY